jgi:hypothetical protein
METTQLPLESKMLRLGDRIRLTPREVDRLRKITGFEPVDVKSVHDLEEYVARCKRHYWGTSRETRLLHWLIDEERQALLTLGTVSPVTA